jgi:hypothetical protein
MNSEGSGLGIEFTEEQLTYVEQLSGIGFLPRKIGITLGIPSRLIKWFVSEMHTEGTTLNFRYLKGKYLTEANARKNLTESSKGSFTAFKEMRELEKETEVEELKRNLEIGYSQSEEPQLALQAQYKDSIDNYLALKEFIAKGSSDNLPAYLQEYWIRLSCVHDLISNFDNRAKGRKYVVRQLRLKYPDVTENTAYRMINEAVSFFNTDLDKSHWRNILTEALDKVIAVSWKLNRMDWIIKAIREQAEIQGLKIPDADPIPEDLLGQKTIIINSDLKLLGFEPVDPKDLLARIRKYNISKADKTKLARDAGIEDVEFEDA